MPVPPADFGTRMIGSNRIRSIMHLAQLNISVWKIDDRSEAARPFNDNVARMNALAERSPGFVWRLLDEGRDENGANLIGGRDTLMTLSVWESLAHLEAFAFNTVHRKIYQRKGEWFHKLQSHHLVMWWVEEGHRPDLAEAKARIDHINAHGNTDFAFDWAHYPDLNLARTKGIA
jgi:heme-degrading monooxygenase HmoA